MKPLQEHPTPPTRGLLPLPARRTLHGRPGPAGPPAPPLLSQTSTPGPPPPPDLLHSHTPGWQTRRTAPNAATAAAGGGSPPCSSPRRRAGGASPQAAAASRLEPSPGLPLPPPRAALAGLGPQPTCEGSPAPRLHGEAQRPAAALTAAAGPCPPLA